ncbi:unnamed protein product [Clonostachys rosea]|uniref:Uncharacterized protein n=1 Tax=Bionectria ochroleuca TaxID=29856 RepID=A0ABY6TZJ1_BIOOC|nr:unnamed protein product [Clonostachys rosea]
MGSKIAKRTPAKEGRSPIATRRSASKNIKNEQTPSPSPAKSTSSRHRTPRTGFTHRLPTAEERKSNGRVPGRNLIVWGRPRMAEKLLLHMQYELARHKIQVPWDTVAHRLHPGSSGAAIVQHLNRIRRELVAKGHLVPPATSRNGAIPPESTDPTVRGFVRKDMDGEDKESVRPVRYDEPMDDRKFNLPSADNLGVIAENTEFELNDTEDSDNEDDAPQLNSNSPSDDSVKSMNSFYHAQPNSNAYAPLQAPVSFGHTEQGFPALGAMPTPADEKFFAGNGNSPHTYHGGSDGQFPGFCFPGGPFPNPMMYNQAMPNDPFSFTQPQGQDESSSEQKAKRSSKDGRAGPKGPYPGHMPMFPHGNYPYGYPWMPFPMNPYLAYGASMHGGRQQTPVDPKGDSPRGDDSLAVQDAQSEQPNMDDFFGMQHSVIILTASKQDADQVEGVSLQTQVEETPGSFESLLEDEDVLQNSEKNEGPVHNLPDEEEESFQNFLGENEDTPKNLFGENENTPQNLFEDNENTPQNLFAGNEDTPQNLFGEIENSFQTSLEESGGSFQTLLEDEASFQTFLD